MLLFLYVVFEVVESMKVVQLCASLRSSYVQVLGQAICRFLV